MSHTVSLVTITQLSRFQSIKILYKMILKQTYSNIIEWVIVEGSDTVDRANINKIYLTNFINEITPTLNFPIRYIPYSGFKLGGLRNLGNTNCRGDIIVCLDDDDYYPPSRVEEAVDKLSNSPCLIGGVSNIYMYDFFINKLYQFDGFTTEKRFHSTNHCMAYKKEYLLRNMHDPNAEYGEERSFTKQFSIPLIPFDSKKTIIGISHNINTIAKREFCVSTTAQYVKGIREIDEPITNYIDADIFQEMKALYCREEKSVYDVVFVFGGYTRKMNPHFVLDYDDNEYSMIKLAKEYKKQGKKVAIYGNFVYSEDPEYKKNNTLNKYYKLDDFQYNGIQYVDWKKFPFNHTFKKVILYNVTGFVSTILFPIKAKEIIWHYFEEDKMEYNVNKLYPIYKNKINKIVFKNDKIREKFENHFLSKQYRTVSPFEQPPVK